MKKIVLCVPNISEGKDCEKINLIASVVEMPGSKLLDMSSDTNHNRSVITFGGEPEAVKQAAFNLIKKAAELIDMSKHKGEHPRMGAVDVCPFVPFRGVSMEDCVKLARGLAKSANRLDLAGYFYECAAISPEKTKLSNIRAGEYEGLEEKLKKLEWFPDFGPAEFNPKFGVMAIGARDFLIAFNVNLETLSLDIAARIARIIRGSGGVWEFNGVRESVSGMLSTVHAKKIDTRQKGYVQVSTNLCDYKKHGLSVTFGIIKSIAESYVVGVHSSEIVGLLPRDALKDVSLEYLQLKDFNPQKQIIEEALGLWLRK